MEFLNAKTPSLETIKAIHPYTIEYTKDLLQRAHDHMLSFDSLASFDSPMEMCTSMQASMQALNITDSCKLALDNFQQVDKMLFLLEASPFRGVGVVTARILLEDAIFRIEDELA